MKTEIVERTDNTFKPVTVELTFETQRELDVFASLCNSTYITDAVISLYGAMPDYEILRENGACASLPTEILNAILATSCVQARLKDIEKESRESRRK